MSANGDGANVLFTYRNTELVFSHFFSLLITFPNLSLTLIQILEFLSMGALPTFFRKRTTFSSAAGFALGTAAAVPPVGIFSPWDGDDSYSASRPRNRQYLFDLLVLFGHVYLLL